MAFSILAARLGLSNWGGMVLADGPQVVSVHRPGRPCTQAAQFEKYTVVRKMFQLQIDLQNSRAYPAKKGAVK